MKKRFLSFLLTACMAFSAVQPAVVAANAPTVASVSEDTPVAEIAGTDLDENLAGDGYITEVMAADKDDFLNQYRSLLA